MGQVIVELPQNVYRTYHVDDSAFSEQLLRDLDENSSVEESQSAIIPPRRNTLVEDGDAVLGIWADREESAMEIARRIRENNRKTT
jgi:hypothetical protein